MRTIEQPRIKERDFTMQVELCSGALTLGGETFEPDAATAYMEFHNVHGMEVAYDGKRVKATGVTAYGVGTHPAVVKRSYRSMRHKVVNRGHVMKSYYKDGQKSPTGEATDHDRILGFVAGVELAGADGKPYHGNGQLGAPGTGPHIRGVMGIHKNADGVPKILGEHLGGRHIWTVSAETEYSLLESGFIVFNASDARSAAKKILDAKTPSDLSAHNAAYVPLVDAPEDMFALYSSEKRTMLAADWNGLPIALLKGGLDGEVFFSGQGVVRYGAESEAHIQRVMACDPRSLEREALEEITQLFQGWTTGLKELAAELRR